MEGIELELKRHNDLPDWGQSFLSTFSTQFQNIEQEASINVKNLPKVVWNDNTFYVSLDKEDGNADVLNEYGNVVTALKNVASVEDVEQQLNKQIIADIVSPVEPTIKKETTKNSAKEAVNNVLEEELLKVAQTMNYMIEDENKPTEQVIAPTSSPAPTDELKKEFTDKINSVNSKVASNEKALKTMQKKAAALQKELTAYKSKYAGLTKIVDELNNKVKDLTDHIHAYTDPGNVYDLNSEKAEVEHFNETARQSAHEIDIEHKTDLTTPRGRISLKELILQDIGDIKEPTEILVQDTLPNKVEVQIVDQRPVKLDEKASEEFKQCCCPQCHCAELKLTTKDDTQQKVRCASCNSQFSVNLDTEEIYFLKNEKR